MQYALATSDTITFFQNTVTLRRPGVANFTDTIKTAMLIKATFKKSIQVEIAINYVLKCNSYL